jgi:ubiquinol-cytochrome c reductase cytochrome b subunit
MIHNHIIDYPSPSNLTYFWSFGFLASICLVIQILTGLFLALFYTPHIEYAFYSVEFIMRDIPNGWLIRYLHANGASMFFIIVFIHMFRGFYYGSYMAPREILWCSGVLIFLIMMGTAFLGYVLPWGQMSFWGASVITRLITVLPFHIGISIVQWFWGGFSIDNPTLKRIYTLHFLLPFIILALVYIHIALLHRDGSNNPLGIETNTDKISFFPYFYNKDLFLFFLFFVFFSLFVFYFPNILGHSDNYIKANSLKTPAHIVPEWYFLCFYAILRAIPSKAGGIIAMFGAIIILILLPFINLSTSRSITTRPFFEYFFWFVFFNCMFLTWIGQAPVKEPYILLGQIATFLYFFNFLIIFPFITLIENYINLKKY